MAKDNKAATTDDLLTQAVITNRLLAAQLRDKTSQKEMVRLLMTTGASDREIADVLNTTAATVGVARRRIQKEIKGNDKKDAQGSEPGTA